MTTTSGIRGTIRPNLPKAAGTNFLILLATYHGFGVGCRAKAYHFLRPRMLPFPDVLNREPRIAGQHGQLIPGVMKGIRVVVGGDPSGLVGERLQMDDSGGLEEGGVETAGGLEHVPDRPQAPGDVIQE